MPKQKKDPVQQALKDLLTSPKVKRQIASNRKTPGSPKDSQALTQAVGDGNIEVLCDYLRKNPTSEIPQPICQLMERLDFLYRNIDIELAHPDFDPTPTHETFLIDGEGFLYLPLGTSDAAYEALLEITRAWVEGFAPGYTVAKKPSSKKKTFKKRGPKSKVTSREVYLDDGVRVKIFHEILGCIRSNFPKEELKKNQEEDSKQFRIRCIKLVGKIYEMFMEKYQYDNATPEVVYPYKGVLGGELPDKYLPLESSIVETVTKQAMTKKKLNIKKVLYGLFAYHEKGDPTKLRAIDESIRREENDNPKLIPPEFRPSSSKKTSKKA